MTAAAAATRRLALLWAAHFLENHASCCDARSSPPDELLAFDPDVFRDIADGRSIPLSQPMFGSRERRDASCGGGQKSARAQAT